jgi:uncharacterized protein
MEFTKIIRAIIMFVYLPFIKALYQYFLKILNWTKILMPTKIQITAGTVKLQAKLNDCPTAQLILNALPIRAKGNIWGGEIYFTIPVKAKLEKDNSRDVLEEGELGYWPAGSAFCIFFGKTPMSQKNEIRAASAVNILGKITDDLSGLWKVEDGAEVIIEKGFYYA